MGQRVYTVIPDESFLKQLKEMVPTEGDKYILNRATFKRCIENGSLIEWVSSLHDYVCASKRKYLYQISTVSQFITVVKQFLNALNVPFTFYSNVVRGNREPLLIFR